MMIVDNKFDIGELVYLSTDEEAKPRLITGLKICPDECIVYQLTQAGICSEHYDFEITREKIAC